MDKWQVEKSESLKRRTALKELETHNQELELIRRREASRVAKTQFGHKLSQAQLKKINERMDFYT